MLPLERKMEILQILSAERQTTVKRLAEHFGVSEKSIRRDIETLTLSYPIYPVSGNGGGIRVMNGWYVNRHYLTADQEALLKELMEGLQPEKAALMQSILKSFSKPNN